MSVNIENEYKGDIFPEYETVIRRVVDEALSYES